MDKQQTDPASKRAEISYVLTRADLTEFAKLIIKQCANQADANYNNGFCPVGNLIIDHFGDLK